MGHGVVGMRAMVGWKQGVLKSEGLNECEI